MTGRAARCGGDHGRARSFSSACLESRPRSAPCSRGRRTRRWSRSVRPRTARQIRSDQQACPRPVRARTASDRRCGLCRRIAPAACRAPRSDIFVTSGCPRGSQRGFNAICYKMKGSAALHRDWWPRMVRQHENGNVIRWVWTPPAFPVFILPGAADRPKHVSAKNRSPQVRRAARCKVIVNAPSPLILAKHLLKCSRGIEPGMERRAAHTQGIVYVLGESPHHSHRETLRNTQRGVLA